MSKRNKRNTRQQDYTRIVYVPGKGYLAWHRGNVHGTFPTMEDAQNSLWRGPIFDDLLHYQNELYLKRIVQRNAEQLRKALELEQQDG